MLIGWGLMSAALAAQPQHDKQPEAKPPAPEFLEFLGEWSEEDQAWLDTQQQQTDEKDKTPQTEVDDHEHK
jgi:hypothetical protein